LKLTLTFHSRKIKIESLSPRWVNDQIATLPFGGVKKYYDGSVAFYFKMDSFFVFDSAIPKFLFDPTKKGKILFFFAFFFFLT